MTYERKNKKVRAKILADTSNRPVSEMVERLWNLHRRGLSYASDKPAVNLLLADLSEGIADAARALAAITSAEDAVERAHKAGEKTLRFYIESDHDFSIEYMAMGTVQDALREYRAALNAAALRTQQEVPNDRR